jgi:hypothetical protein
MRRHVRATAMPSLTTHRFEGLDLSLLPPQCKVHGFNYKLVLCIWCAKRFNDVSISTYEKRNRDDGACSDTL